MRTKTIGYLEQDAISDALYDVLYVMSNMRDEEAGFSFVTRLDYLESWLKDVDTDRRERQAEEPAGWQEVVALVKALNLAGLDCVMVCNDKCLKQEPPCETASNSPASAT